MEEMAGEEVEGLDCVLATSEQSFLDVDTTLNDNTEPQIFLEEGIPTYISSKLCKSILYQSQKSFLCFSSPCLNLSCSQHYVIPSFQSWVKFYSFWHLGLAERESHTKGQTEPQNFVKTLKTH